MKISKLQLINFKRFSDLVIANIPNDSKFVLLIGSNGSGKSSVFDAFEFLNLISKNEGLNTTFASSYLAKNKEKDFHISVVLDNGSQAEVSLAKPHYSGKKIFTPFSFYGRTSFRQTPRLTRTSLGQQGFDIEKDSDRPKYYIDLDRRFENDIEYITAIILKEFFRSSDSKEQIREKYILPINTALKNIFGDGNGTKLQLIEIIPPLEGNTAQINFKKGVSEIHYNFLSAGEKEVFNILFNLLSRVSNYKDSIYFLDEIDLHLHTQLQFNLIKEIAENWVPENCQLWVASHALGFIDYARQYEHAAIIDFNDIDFDFSQILEPVSKKRIDVYDVAIPKEIIKNILKNSKKVVVENKNDEFYNLALAEKGFLFLPGNNNREVFLTVKSDKGMIGLRDRDYLRDDEITAIKAKLNNLKILQYSTFENYIYHPENISELNWSGFDKQTYLSQIILQKNNRLLQIVDELASARQHYIEFKDCIKDDSNREPIIEALKSNQFDSFYPFFNMKRHFNKAYLNQFKYQLGDLVKTNWFKTQIEAILNS